MLKFIGRFIVNIFLAIDQLLNTILLGHPDETISSRLGRSMGKERFRWVKWFRVFVDALFFFDTAVEEGTGRKIKHCEKSVMPLEQENFRTFTDYELWNWNSDGREFKKV